MRSAFVLLVPIALAACGSSDPGPGGATSGEAKALDDAAEMLEARKLPDSALRPPAEQPPASGAPAK